MIVQAPALTTREILIYSLVAIASFHLAYAASVLSFCILLFLGCLFALRRVARPRFAFYVGLGIGLAIYGFQLAFFLNIFGLFAVALWLVPSFWLGLFLALLQGCHQRFGDRWAAVLAPFLWAGIEYFRSELYYLKFSWVNAGYAFWESPQLMNSMSLGVMGWSFLLMALAAGLWLLPKTIRVIFGGVLLFAVFLAANLPTMTFSLKENTVSSVRVAGLHTHSLDGPSLLEELDQLIENHPDTQLVVLGEYTFAGPPPEEIRDWCRLHNLHLIAGGTEPLPDDNFYDTAFVVGPNGKIVFKQAKSVPVQFFADGLPAPSQKLWESPWGKIGLAICYDLSYARVMDRLVRQGAQALIIPTLDELSWGEQEHRHHARVAPVKAAEYRIPIFRLGSCGISQLVDQNGRTLARTEFPGRKAVLTGALDLQQRGRLPLDRWLIWMFVPAPAALLLYFGWTSARRSLEKRLRKIRHTQ